MTRPGRSPSSSAGCTPSSRRSRCTWWRSSLRGTSCRRRDAGRPRAGGTRGSSSCAGVPAPRGARRSGCRRAGGTPLLASAATARPKRATPGRCGSTPATPWQALRWATQRCGPAAPGRPLVCTRDPPRRARATCRRASGMDGSSSAAILQPASASPCLPSLASGIALPRCVAARPGSSSAARSQLASASPCLPRPASASLRRACACALSGRFSASALHSGSAFSYPSRERPGMRILWNMPPLPGACRPRARGGAARSRTRGPRRRRTRRAC